ncbi:MAG TPA: ThiF family adenylyltransferase [Anaeromyxobacteraceae bacterium]|nr:ThiF family adenylyltransferase [Anaeromyxobacteraceae bacterium]
MNIVPTDKSALVFGAGGLGGPALLVLCSAGVRRIVLVEEGKVESSDLSWQPLFREVDVGARRGASAAARLSLSFPGLAVEAREGPLDDASLLELARSTDVVIDGAVELATKFRVNDAAVAAHKPLVHGGLVRYSAQLLTVMPGSTGCLRCLFEAPPGPNSVPTCAEAGVLGPLAGLAGSLMGSEAVRLLAGERGTYAGRLVVYEARGARSRAVPLRPRAGCPTCGHRHTQDEPATQEAGT